MAGKRFLKKYQGNYGGWSSRGTHLTAIAIQNDESLGNFVYKNKKALLSLSKADKLALIKKHTKQSWAKNDLRQVNSSNVKAKELNFIIRDLGR